MTTDHPAHKEGAAPKLAPGTLFDRRYRILGALGSGGSGTVYRACDEAHAEDTSPSTLRVVALKVLRSEVTHPLVNRGFEIEFGVLARLRHPNLVRVDRFATTEEGERYLTAECIDGPNLRRATRQRDPAVLLRLAHGILLALDHLHRHGYVHHDVKPSNILVAEFDDPIGPDAWIPKLADLGTAALTGSDPMGMLTGTVAYLSPERLRGGVADPRSDLWSLGMTLYSCATGSLPLRATTPTGALRLLRRGPIAALRDVRPDAPRALEQLVNGLMAPDPRNRFRSAAEALAELQRALPAAAVPSLEVSRDAIVQNASLVGRDEVLATAETVLRGRSAAAVRALVVRGPAGSGRTRVLSEVALRGQLHEARLVRVEAGVGLGPWVTALKELRGVGADEPERPTAETIAGHLVAELSRAPALVVCDDLDRRDALAWHIIDRVASALAAVSVPHTAGLLVSVDSAVGGDDALLDPTGVVEVTLAPLHDGDVASLCASVLGEAPKSVCETVARQSGGSPALAVESLRHLLSVGALRRVGGSWQLDTEAAGSFGGHDRRLAVLAPAARRVLDTLALFGPAGTPVSLGVLEAAAAIPSEDLLTAIEQVCAAQLVRLVRSRQSGTTLGHTSEAVRSACAGGVAEARRMETHDRAFRALQEAGETDPGSLSIHAIGAGRADEALRLATVAAEDALERGDGLAGLAAVEIAERAAATSLPGALRTVRRLRARALLQLGRVEAATRVARDVSLQEPGDVAAALLRAEAAAAAVDVRGFQDAIQHLDMLLAHGETSERERVHLDVLRVQQARLAGRPRDARTLGTEALERMDRCGDAADEPEARARLADRARLHAELGQVALSLGDVAQVKREFGACMELREQLGDDVGIAEAETYLAAGCDLTAESDEALRHISRGLEHAQRARSNTAVARVLNVRGAVLVSGGKLDDAAEAFAEAERRALLAGFPRMVSVAVGNRAIVHERQGLYGRSLDAALLSFRTKARLHDRTGQVHTLLNLAIAYVKIGDLLVASRIVRRVADEAQAQGLDSIASNALLTLAWVVVEGGDAHGGLSILDDMEQRYPGSLTQRNSVEELFVRARAAHKLRRRGQAVSLIDASLALADAGRDVHKRAWLRIERARVLASIDESDLRRAVDLAERAGSRELAWTGRACLGLLLQEQGSHMASGRELRRASEALDELLADLPRRHWARYLRAYERPLYLESLQATRGWSEPLRAELDDLIAMDEPTALDPRWLDEVPE